MSTFPDDLRERLVFQLTPGLGPVRTAALLAHFGSPGAVLRASAAELADVPGIGPGLAQRLPDDFRAVDPGPELAWAARCGVNLLGLGGPGYPPSLAEIPDAPGLLYVRGAITPGDAEAVALVGSRACSDYGLRHAARLATGLARAGVTVVSGLARGIDGAAHKAALEAGGRTLAVLAGGLSRIYPPEHLGLADEVAHAGALITESCMGQEPTRGLFPQRNRIISGLCRVSVLVEADEKSGALITATHAAEQGRTAMAVPGPVDSPTSRGCHALLRKGAVLCRGVDDILEELRGVSAVYTAERTAARGEAAPGAPAAPVVQAAPPPQPTGPPAGLDEVQTRVWEYLGPAGRSIDELAQHLAMPIGALAGVLLTLEMRRAVKRQPGNRYERR